MPPDIDLTVYPDECDAFGHLNQASFLSLFERARWEMLARGPGMDVFTRAGAWPAVRKAVVDYHAAAFPGDVLRFHQVVTHRGRTSFTMRQTARRMKDDVLVATAELVFVCISGEGRPIPVPGEFAEFMSPQGRSTPADTQRLTVNGVTLPSRSAARDRRSSSCTDTRSTIPSGASKSMRWTAIDGSRPTFGEWASRTLPIWAMAWASTPTIWPRCSTPWA